MIQAFVDRWMAAQDSVAERWAKELPGSYSEIVDAVIEAIHDEDDYDGPSAERITAIGHGDYQGTTLYIIGGSGYQTSEFWWVFVSYGSCSGCDTLEAIRSEGDWDGPPTPQQVKDCMSLALHIVQSIKKLEGDA